MEIIGLLDIPGCLLVPVGLIMALCLCVYNLILGNLLYESCSRKSRYSWHKQSYFRRLCLPTKPTTLILGDMPLQFKKGFGYIDVESIQKYGKVFGTYLGSCPSLVVADAEIIKHIMVKDFSNFTDRKMSSYISRCLAMLEKKVVKQNEEHPDGFDINPLVRVSVYGSVYL